jgi:hypothetical protein
MCTGTDKLDIALAADGVDIIPASIDGTPADARANEKLNFNRTFAFQNFTVDTADKMKEYSTISIPNTSKAAKDKFNLVAIDAKKDLSLAMLVQNHESSIKEFMGSTTAFNRGTIKPSVSILGGTATDAKYLHGIRGAGAFTFYAGHDPEDFEHLVGDKATDLNSYKQSAGYRLILNNILLQTVTAKMLGVSDISSINVQVSPNPIINSYTIELQGEDTKQAKLTIYNLNGQVVVKEEIHNELGNYKKTFDSSTYASGLYVVEVSNNKGVIGKKLISKAGL